MQQNNYYRPRRIRRGLNLSEALYEKSDFIMYGFNLYAFTNRLCL